MGEPGLEPGSLILRPTPFLPHNIAIIRHSLLHALGSGQSREAAGKTGRPKTMVGLATKRERSQLLGAEDPWSAFRS